MREEQWQVEILPDRCIVQIYLDILRQQKYRCYLCSVHLRTVAVIIKTHPMTTHTLRHLHTIKCVLSGVAHRTMGAIYLEFSFSLFLGRIFLATYFLGNKTYICIRMSV